MSILRILLLVLSVAVAPAYAAAPKYKGTYAYANAPASGLYDSFQLLANAYCPIAAPYDATKLYPSSGTVNGTVNVYNANTQQCSYPLRYKDGMGLWQQFNRIFQYQYTLECAYGSRDASKPWDQQCPDLLCQDKAGKQFYDNFVTFPYGSPEPTQVCKESCLASFSTTIDVTFDNETTYMGNGVWTGEACAGVVDPALSQAQFNQEYINNIKSGKCPGEVNGQTVWVQCSSTSEKSTSSSTTTNPDGTTSTTSQTSKTTCGAGECTTTKTTTNPDGTATTTSSQQDQDSYCKSNPDVALCKSSAYSATACDATPTCQGDAIQCAMAAKQHESYCAFKAQFTTDDPTLSNTGTSAINGTHANANPLQAATTSTFSFSSQFNASGGGGCPADFTVGSYTIPFSKTCDGLNALGLACLGISLLWAARIVFGS